VAQQVFHLAAGLLLFQRCLGRREAGNQQPVGRAGDVVESGPVAELDGLWISTMFSAQPTLRLGRVARPRSVAISISWPTPAWSSVANGSCLKIPAFMYAGRKLLMSSREMPKVVLGKIVGAES